MGQTTPLGEYLLRLCEQRHLSMREASTKAGLSPTAINQIVRRGKSSTPRPDTLRLIADALGGNYRYMMQLAGHLEAGPTTPLAAIPRLQEFVTRLSEMPARQQRAVMETATMLLELVGDSEDAETPDAPAVLPEPPETDARDG